MARSSGARILATAASAVLIALMCAPVAHADFATGGAGRFLGAIDWFSWGAHNTALPNSGFSQTQTRVIGDQTIAVTCAVEDITSTAAGTALRAYRPGSWQGDGLDEMYNIGGTGNANQLVVGLSTSARTVTFDFACSATLNGVAFPLAGLVLADAEQMSATGNEFIEATIAPSATWRVIDRYRSANCAGQTQLNRSADNTLRFGASTALCPAGPAVVGFMDGASSATVRFQGGGVSAIALGVVASFDHGDAPTSYGDAAHLAQYGFSGGTVPTGRTVLSHDPAFQLGTTAQPPTRLGATVDPEDVPHTSDDATGDDSTGNGVFGPADDEDAIAAPGTVTVVPGGTHTVADITCVGPGSVAGWIDWNTDGDFDTGERSDTVDCAGGSVDLTWTVPADVLPALDEATFMRLRIAADAGDIASPSGVALSGEAEDYAVRVAVPTITLTKSLPARADGDDQFTVTVQRGGTTVGSATTAGADTSATTGAVAVQPGGTYRVLDIAGPSALLADYVPTIACVNTLTGAQFAPTGSAPEWTLPDLGPSDQFDCTVTNALARPAVLLTKNAGPLTDVDGNGPDAGDTVEFTFVVTNTGNVALDPVTVDDPTVGPVSCPGGALAPGRSVECGPVTYAVSQEDVNAGTLTNTATATGTAPSGAEVDSTDSTTTPIPVRRALELDKTAGALTDVDGNGPDAGDTVSFAFTVTNTGNVPLDPVVVDDPLVGPVTCPAGALAPGAAITCDPLTRPLSQEEVNAGTLANTATATGTAPDGGTATDTDHTTTPIVSAPAVSLAKSVSAVADLDGNGVDAGDTVTYTFTVTNVGNVTLDPVTVDDPVVGPVTCPPGALAPTAVRMCTAAPYVLTQADVDAGSVENTATATGTSPSGEQVTGTDTVTTPIAVAPSVSVVKLGSAVVDGDGDGHDAGDTITYTFTVTNSGNVTLDPVTVADPKVGPVTCPPGPLAPGGVLACTAAPYVLTQSDVDFGAVDNTATVIGLPPTGDPVTGDDTVTTPVTQAPAIGLTKTAGATEDTDGNGLDAGDTVAYTFTVANNGNVTLDPVVVSDPKVGPVTCPDGPLAPGDSVECTAAPYVLTQSDVDSGELANTATATGTDPAGATVTSDDSATVAIPTRRDITLDKTAGSVTDTDGDGVDAGDTITFTFEVTNTGNVTLDPVTVVDPTVGAVTCPPGPLAPGASVDCTAAPYVLTQSDVDTGVVDNTATATGTDPTGTPVEAGDSTQTLISADGAIDLTKTAGEVADADDNGVDAGDTIAYPLTVTNTGNVTLHDITVTDPMLGTVVCPPAPLAPGASVDCAADTYSLTQADIDAGAVSNTAVATGLTPTGQPVADTATADKVLAVRAALTLDKAATLNDTDDDGKAQPGETIDYTFTVTNTGAVTITAVAIGDPSLDPAPQCPPAPLAPGDSVVCTATYTVTAADATAGAVRNTATATGRTTTGTTVTSPPDTTTVPASTPPDGTTPPPPDDSTPPAPHPPTSGDLPDTGAATATATTLGGLLLATGIGVLLMTRRRPDESEVAQRR